MASKKQKRVPEVVLSWAQLQQELSSFAEALATAQALRAPAAVAAANFDLAEAYRARWQRLKISAVVAARANAITAYETAVALYQSLNDPGAETRARLALAAFYQQTKQLQNAREQFETSLVLASALNSPELLLTGHLGLCETLLSLDHQLFGRRFNYVSHHTSHTQIADPALVKAAWQSCLAAEKLILEIGSPADKARLRLSMGIIRLKKQAPLLAIPEFKAAWLEAKEARRKDIRAEVAENLTLVYSRLEQWSKVSHYAKLARSLRPEPAEIIPKPVAEEQLAFTADNQHLVYLSRFGLVQIWRLPAGERIQTIHTGPYEHAALSRDGSLVATVADNNIRIWQTLTGELVSAFAVEGRIAGLAIRPDNKLLLTFHYLEVLPKYTKKGLFPFARFWDLASGKQTGEIELPPPGFCGVTPRHVDAEWQTVVIGLIYESPYGYDRVRLHICPLKSEPPYFVGDPGHKQRFQDADVTAVAVGTGGTQVAIAISVAGNSHVRQQAEQRFQLWRLGHHYPLNPVNVVKTMAATTIGLPLALLFGGRRWHTSSRSTDTRPQKPLLEQFGELIEETISGFPTFKKQTEFASRHARSRWLLLTPDEDILISGHQGGTIQLRRLPDGFQLQNLQQHQWAVTLGILRPDGHRLASADETGQLVFWEIPAGTCLHTTHFPLPLTKLATSPNGAYLACSRQDGQIAIFAWGKPQAEPLIFDPADDF